MELCVIPRMVEVVANEIALECALVTVVIGSRPETSSADVHAYLMGHFGVELRSFMVHPHYLEDFLVMFRDANAMMQVMHAQVLEGVLRIIFRLWCQENWLALLTWIFT